ncbi:14-3-3 domain-containing protein [Fusarium falciforme]|uniref:14-3-3 domain-containing protein n=1 Tax=Fusarium falciforme TaxID=195108 RepID=UPI0023016B53|nr:14-3-3 domain-containing protein [Fusarium falciforme]WAO97138.1 14-3-3 domain-containing protein [Fusarium falciforme]
MQRKNQVFLARLCSQAERYDDMVPLLKEVIQRGGELSVDERNLLTTAFNNVFDTRRASWRIISSVEKNEYKGSEKHLATIRGYRIKIENEIEKICRDVLDLLDQSLIPNASTSESMALYYKMKGDYSRYLTEFVSGEKHNLAVTSAYNAYKAELDALTKEPDGDSILLMQLLCNNLTLWASSDSGEREGISCRKMRHIIAARIQST